MILTDMTTHNKDKQKIREEEQRRLQCRLWDPTVEAPRRGFVCILKANPTLLETSAGFGQGQLIGVGAGGRSGGHSGVPGEALTDCAGGRRGRAGKHSGCDRTTSWAAVHGETKASA